MKRPRQLFSLSGRMPSFALAIIMASALLLVQCTALGTEDFGFQEEIQQYFGDMHYGKTVFADTLSPVSKSDINYQEGAGELVGADGDAQTYKWVYLTGVDGDLLSGYIGTSAMDSTTVVELTQDETKDALRRCAAQDDHDQRTACLDRVVDAIFVDCQASLSLDDCHEQCWLTPDACVGN